MKKVICFLSAALLAEFIAVGTAGAYPYLDDIWAPGQHILPQTGTCGDWVYLTDLTDPETTMATLVLEASKYESGFGIYDPKDHTNRLLLFEASAEPPSVINLDQTEVEFDLVKNTATITASYNPSFVGNSITIGTTFGFYLDSNSSGTYYYTDQSLNPDTTAVEHGLIYATSGDEVVVAFEDLDMGAWGGWEPDYDDFVVKVSDVKPIPEASTLVFFGSGLSGLLFLARKRRLMKV
jgi:hypothetical protein